MDTGAAILNFGDEFGPNSVDKAMSNNGPNLREQNIPNKVTPYTKVDHSGSPDSYDTPEQLKSVPGSTTNTQ